MNLEKVKAVELGNFDISAADVHYLSHCDEVTSHGSIDAAELIYLAYKYGFMRGRKAEHTRHAQNNKI